MTIGKRIALAIIVLVILAMAVVSRTMDRAFVERQEEPVIVEESPTYIPPTPEPTPEPVEAPVPVSMYAGQEVQSSFFMELSAQRSAPERPIPELASDYEIELIARTIWGEAGGCKYDEHRAAVAWCILNRVDAWNQSIEEVVKAEGQFHGYIRWGTCPQEHIEMAEDVVERWEREHDGQEDVGRVLPKDYLWFCAYEGHNRYRNAFSGSYNVWDFSSASPY